MLIYFSGIESYEVLWRKPRCKHHKFKAQTSSFYNVHKPNVNLVDVNLLKYLKHSFKN